MDQRTGIIGCFAEGTDLCDGQTVKTRNLYMMLERYAGIRARRADTWALRRNPVRLLADTMKCMLLCRHIFLMVSVNGMKFYLPFLYYLNKITRRRIYHYVIGSELLELTRENPRLIKYLNALEINWFEYESGTRQLQSMGVRNAQTLPNCKVLAAVSEPEAYEPENGVYRFCTFSRVMEEKGITEAIKAIAHINREKGTVAAHLDIYGPVDAAYRNAFEALLSEHADCVTYQGVADSGSSVEILKGYYALLFPTRWAGEGVPGTLIDAFASGLPIIASDWNANRELISHHFQGLLYPEADMQTLADAVRWAIAHPAELDQMRKNSRRSYEHYTPETIMTAIINRMEGAGVS